MTSEFTRVGTNNIQSLEGFTVTWRPTGGLDYTDEQGAIFVESELLLKPLRVLIYPRSGGLRALPEVRAEEIVERIVRALEYLGYQVER